MASKTVQPLVIDLGIKGAEKLAGLKSSFRDLSKTVGLTDSGLEEARQGIIKYAKSANQSEALIRGQIKAFEGLREQAALGGKLYLELGTQIAQLKSDLRGSSDAVEEQRAALLKAGQAAKGSAVDIRSVVAELERLQKSARPGSSAFAQLSKDIAVLKSQLKETNVEVKKFNAGFEISQRPAMSLEKIQRQVGRLTEGLKGLNFISDDFLNVQQRIALLGQVQSATIGRQQVIARERMFAGQAFEAFAAGPAGKLDLPKTVAALNLEINELQDRLSNTVPGQTYANLTVEIANKQRELQQVLTGSASAYDKLAAAQDRSARVAQKIADIQQYQATTVGRMAPGVGGYRDPETGAMIARGRGQVADRAAYRRRGESFVEEVVSAAQRLGAIPALPMAGTTTAPGTGAAMSGMARSITGQVDVTRRPLVSADLPRDYLERVRANLAAAPSAAVGVAPGVGFGEQIIKKQVSALKEAAAAYRPYNKAIRDARAANNGSISSINNLKNALIAKRNEVPTTSAAFRRLTSEIENLDRKSERVSRRMSRRRMSPMQMTQAAGAVLSGGIFGGPEGFLGGAIGALGGVGGAFAGAAIGAQVGGLRRQLGEFADYAAEVKRLEIALKGITEVQDDAVASQANYSRAVAAAANVTRDLNVPQEVAIRGITRLTAAVKGAGGGVADAELAFKNITSAITATGGGAEQVQGAVTALVQIFSKGKVSAEEINQIAERLPGTFNKIAEASGRTGPELTKALQKGEVGLNDLMKFLVQLGGEYGELAKEIARSSEAAGQRLQVAYNNMRIEVGNALQPIGAEFQDAFTEFIKDITPTLVAVLPKIGEFFLLLAKNIDTVVVAMTGALAVFAVGKIAAIVASIGSLSAAFFTLKLNAIVATKALIGLNGAALLNPYTALAAGVAAFAANLFLAAERQEKLNTLIRQGAVEEVGSKISQLRTEQAEIEQRSLKPLSALEKSRDLILGFDSREADRIRLGEIKELLPQLEERQRTARIDVTQGAGLSGLLLSGQLTQFEKPKPDATGGGTGGGTGDKGPKSQLERLKAQYESIMRSSKGVLEIEKMRQQQALQLARATADNNQKLITTTNLNNISLDFAEKEIQIENKLLDALSAANKLELEKDQIQARLNAQLEYQIDMKRLLLQTDGAIAGENQRAAIAAEATSKALADQVFSLREQLGLVTDSERIDRFRQDAEKQFGKDDPEVSRLTDLFRQQVDPTFAEGLQQNMRSLRKEMDSLLAPINQVVNAANTIGEAFSNAFTDVVTGSATAKEALAGMMQSIGQSFIKMAAQIIAKQTTMIILGTIMKALGIVGGGGGSAPDPFSSNVSSALPNTSSLADSAAAGTFSFSSPRANGGPVIGNRPYLVGEQGPELFMPRAGGAVTSNSELRQLMGRSPVGNAPAMNFTFETTNIGGQEFVSREQLEAAMLTTRRQAASDGAKRGMNMTLDRMQNSPRTRARVGIS